ncbi:MAG: hypothetical protein DRI73_09815 [Bacteroidetes bacterium]|nr:MAG: hypothetical protein DRI73_09815 [Bacteroidota bacterium]
MKLKDSFEVKGKWNKIAFGLVPGMIAPIVTYFLIYLNLSGERNMVEYFNFLSSTHVLTKFLSLSVVPNLLLFFIFIWIDLLKTARGVLGATMIYAFAVVLIMVLV